jgi:protein tyrosine phosphatase (PTP) superfamily phosphohydrolase (DUF442 family)
MSDNVYENDPADIFMWRRIDARLTTSGQPAEEQLTDLKRLGVTHAVNLALHTHEKALPDEAGSVGALGMRYIHIPVDFNNPADADLAPFCATMWELEGKVIHVHCIANFRVSAFLYRYHRDEVRMQEGEAREMLDCIWRPGGVWARFIGDEQAEALPHRYAKRDY